MIDVLLIFDEKYNNIFRSGLFDYIVMLFYIIEIYCSEF